MEIPVEALAVADADPAVAPVAAAVSAEVSGEPVGVSLLDAVAAGRVPRPAEMPFSEWLKWRAGSGKRPTRGRDGVSTTMQQEAVLWKALMSAYYGEERAEALEEAGAEHASRPSPALSELSGEPGVEELQAVLQSAYDPRKESLDVFEARVNRAAESLLMLGIEVADRQEEVLLEASALGSGGGRLELTEVLKEQTEVLKKAFSNKGPTSSITTVKTDLHWPTLSDDMTDVKDVAEFYESFEDNCGLANNCQGMSKREMS